METSHNMSEDEDLLMDESSNEPDDEFIIEFSPQALDVIRLATIELIKHKPVLSIITCNYPLDIKELTCEYEQRVAKIISLLIRPTYPCSEKYIVNKEYAINRIKVIIDGVFSIYMDIFPHIDSIEYMLSLCPLQIIAGVCNIDISTAHVLAFSVKKYLKNPIEERMLKYTDICGLKSSITNSTSPLTTMEIEALKRFLNTKKSSHIHLLLNIILEYKHTQRLMDKDIITLDDILFIVRSGWFHCYMIAINDLMNEK